MMKAKLWVYLGRTMCCILLLAKTATATAQTLKWTPSERYDDGVDTSLAAHASGLVLDAHQTHAIGGNTLWYHVGMLTGMGVTWGGSQGLPGAGEWPNIAITKEGHVIFVYSTGPRKSNSDLYYTVGKIDPYGGTNQSIQWLTRSTRWDSGFHSSIAVNKNGIIVGVHESGSGGTGLYYRIGHLTNPSGGNYSITWDSGQNGIKYDDGINPHIALNNRNEVVEVHQVTGQNYLHYRRGTLSGGAISLAGSPRYDNNSSEATVALLDSGLVIELHRSNSDGGGYARTGKLSFSNLGAIDWSDSVKISDSARYPAVAANGTYAIGTWTSFSFDITGRLFFSVAAVP
jgi:hypothetical protein